MARGRKTERVIVVRTDSDGNILNYDVVEQPVQPTVVEKTATPRVNGRKTSDKENHDVYESDRHRDNTTLSSTSLTRSEWDLASGTMTSRKKPRRVRYVRPKSTVKIFDEKVEWNAGPKIDANNDEAIERIYNAPQHRIFREKLEWSAQPRIDTHNEEVVERLKSAPKPVIVDTKVKWDIQPRIDAYNEEFIRHKEQKKAIQREKILTRSVTQQWKPKKIDQARIDNHNPQFEEHLIRQKSAKLPPIEDRKLEWEKRPRIDQRNDDYIERLGQKRSTSLIFREKLRWHARPKIDTGLFPESDEEDELNDNNTTA